MSTEDISSDSDSEKNMTINSPIRVTPDRDRRDRKRGRRHTSEKDGSRGKKLSVKERLFVSKKAIGESEDCRVSLYGN